MGTSSSIGGPRPSTPLIPTWIPTSPSPEPPLPEGPLPDKEDQENVKKEKPEEPKESNENRFSQPRKDFRKFTKSKRGDSTALRNALKGFIKTSGGGSSSLSRRLKPSVSRVAIFYNVLDSFKENGKAESLKQLNLEDYANKPLLDILGALMDEIFKKTKNDYDNTQDDSITKQAYTNTINRIAEVENIDLDNLSNDNVEIMVTIFIEETISTRVICDIGSSIVKISDPKEILKIENEVSQIVSGYVRNIIIPEIRAAGRKNKSQLEKEIENIYRIAFDTILGSNN